MSRSVACVCNRGLSLTATSPNVALAQGMPRCTHLPVTIRIDAAMRWLKPPLRVVIATLLYLICSAAQALDIRGDWRQGGLLLGLTAPGTEVTFRGKTVPVSPEGHFVLALDRDAPATVSLATSFKGQGETLTYPVTQRSYDVQYIDGVPQETVTPPPEVLERIEREAAMVASARSGVDPRLDYLGGFSLPLDGTITGVYGSQRVYNGVAKNPHYGLDIAAPTGTLVRAPAPGIVRLVHPDMYFSGGTLILDHGYGIFSTFIHLSAVLVSEGQAIGRGEGIARVGATGRATGPHLDWRINWLDVRIDPAMVVEQFPLSAR